MVSLAGDTLFGQFDHSSRVIRDQKVMFRKSDQEGFLEYEPGQLLAFHPSGRKVYFSKTLPVNGDNQLVFAEGLVSGDASLFRFKSGFYVQKQGSLIIELKEEDIKKFVGGVKRDLRVIHGQGELMYMFSDCNMNEEIGNLKNLSEQRISNLVINYNICKGNPYQEFKKDIEWLKTTFRVGVGLMGSHLTFVDRSRNGVSVASASYPKSFAPAFSARINISSPRLTDRVSFQLGLIFSQHQFTSDSLIVKRNSYEERHLVDIKNKVIKIPFSIQYSFQNKGITPYVNLGGNVNLPFNFSHTWFHEVEYNVGVINSNERQALEAQKINMGIWGGFGTTITMPKGWTGFVEMRMERGLNPYIFNASTVENLYNLNVSNIYDLSVLVGIKL